MLPLTSALTSCAPLRAAANPQACTSWNQTVLAVVVSVCCKSVSHRCHARTYSIAAGGAPTPCGQRRRRGQTWFVQRHARRGSCSCAAKPQPTVGCMTCTSMQVTYGHRIPARPEVWVYAHIHVWSFRLVCQQTMCRT